MLKVNYEIGRTISGFLRLMKVIVMLCPPAIGVVEEFRSVSVIWLPDVSVVGDELIPVPDIVTEKPVSTVSLSLIHI